jgi:hypothetical protein
VDGGAPVERLYVLVGRLDAEGLPSARWPGGLPRAGAYLAVWRAEAAAPPDPALVEPLLREYRRLRGLAAGAGQPLHGLQLDVDCPSAELARYAAFLRRLRAGLPSSDELSVTALLDWYRPGVPVAAVVAAVDEHVPQFYDAAPRGAPLRIAEPIDPARWTAALERLGRPYRLGLASFGRILRARPRGPGAWQRVAFPDLGPLDLASAGLDGPSAATNASGEVVVRRAVSAASAHRELLPGDVIEMVLPSGEPVRRGVQAARAAGRRCRGVVVFRWPGRGESLVLTPGEVGLALAGAPAAPGPPRLIATEGACAPRSCTDLAVSVGDRFRAAPLRLRLRSSVAIDYLLPARPGALAAAGPRVLAAAVPSYPGAEVVPLGRVFSRQAARFSMLEEDER